MKRKGRNTCDEETEDDEETEEDDSDDDYSNGSSSIKRSRKTKRTRPLARNERARKKAKKIEELKINHEGKRVNGGLDFDTGRYNYIAHDKFNFGNAFLEKFVCGYCFRHFSRQDLKIKHQALPNVVFVDSVPVRTIFTHFLKSCLFISILFNKLSLLPCMY
jgi:hypothetical protein